MCCVALLCCLFDLSYFFLPSASPINMYIAPGIYIMWDYNDQKECFCFRQDEVSYIEESSSEEEEEEEEEQHDTLSFRHHRQDEDEEDAPEVTMGGGGGGGGTNELTLCVSYVYCRTTGVNILTPSHSHPFPLSRSHPLPLALPLSLSLSLALTLSLSPRSPSLPPPLRVILA